jgi:hypothetical protein
VNRSTDLNNCGTCGLECATGGSCVAGVCKCPADQTACGPAPGQCVDVLTDERFCGGCAGPACGASQACTFGKCCAPGQQVCTPAGGAKTCCDGTGCCAGGCQTAHSAGIPPAATPLGPAATYFDCGTLGNLSRPAAQEAASAWAPTGGTDFDFFFSGNCYARQTVSACATWCYDGNFAGRVNLNTISTACLSPDTLSPFWN